MKQAEEEKLIKKVALTKYFTQHNTSENFIIYFSFYLLPCSEN